MARPASPPDPPEYRYLNTLKWILHVSGLHYFGGAFDPEHMRGIANLAAGAIAERDPRDLPDFDEAMAEAKERALKRADELNKLLLDDDDDDDDDDDPGVDSAGVIG